ncbi:hypothetical protein RO3G_11345 [Rhizopus delemar RA 99-880]|uniref:Uncharacterized protein n=1 Tax=Rhizopus delemar (strain RA 99-880 / ATCC MYA-4621 / FGSC 9543 / NRRL 43880) TaxID=246409 RepID=I1CDV4_RHIO9|nr:hypothetical protein RO3G_11345 [Rhizopus delemar RA 99-880]|eukprot:EIE86634.1 hypothetical protein RO3G_11345 [Rhizopus delemar RA 99-880]
MSSIHLPIKLYLPFGSLRWLRQRHFGRLFKKPGMCLVSLASTDQQSYETYIYLTHHQTFY